MKVTLLSFVMLLGGCSWIGGGMDIIGSKMVGQITDYCAEPLYRREALYILINGALQAQNIEVAVNCPGDEIE